MNYLNDGIVSELKLIMEDDVGFLFSAYLEDCEKQITDLSSCVEARDSDATRRIAHSLKGSSRNVGASYFSDICELLEKDAREQNFESWDSLLSDIEKYFLATKDQIEKEILTH